jgi:ABC transporter transmembrane region
MLSDTLQLMPLPLLLLLLPLPLLLLLLQNSTVGEIVNLMQLDAGRIESLVTSLHPMWDSLLQIIGYSTLLWFVLGPCAFAGFAIMASLIPINTLIFKRLSAYRQQMLRQVTHCCNGYVTKYS